MINLKRNFLLLLTLFLVVTLNLGMSVQAEDLIVPEEDPPAEIPEPLDIPEPIVQENLPGTIQGVGTNFEITDSEYLNVTLISTEPIQLMLESNPNMVTMQIESAEGVASTQITLSGLEPLTTYFKYTDSYRNLEELITDENGTCVFMQDLNESHLVFIQPTASTIFLNNSGWSKPGIGTWDPTTLTATLTTDVFETIQIEGEGITLDGNGYRVIGAGIGTAVYIYRATDITVKNMDIQAFYYGIQLSISSGCNIIDNTSSNNSRQGITIYASTDNFLIGNKALSNELGIVLVRSWYNHLTENTASDNSQRGISIYRSGNITLSDNIISNNVGYGIYAFDYSNYNTFKGNTISDNTGPGLFIVRSSDCTLENNTLYNNLGVGGGYGIAIVDGNNHNLINNIASHNESNGIELLKSSNNNLSSNTAANNGQVGILLRDSSNNTLTDNEASYNGYQGIVIGTYSSGFVSINNSLTGNTANLNNRDGIRVHISSSTIADNIASRNNMNGLYIDGHDNIVPSNLTTINSDFGLLIRGYNHIVSGNTALNNTNGIGVGHNGTSFTGNFVSNNEFGFRVGSQATFSNNTAMDNDWGFYIYGVTMNQNTVFSNRIANNIYGMGLYFSCYNKIYNNDFINNTKQVEGGYFTNDCNIFNLEAPVGGNYYSDFSGPDDNGDGFIDYGHRLTNTWPYGGFSYDYLPLVAPFGGGADNTGPESYGFSIDPGLVVVGSEVMLYATIDDRGAGDSDIYAAEYNIDGGDWIEMSADDETFDQPVENVSISLVAPETAGVYNICVRGIDTFENIGEQVCNYLVVYDPDAGFVTGGGWFSSPEGAYITDPSLVGKSNFGFVAKYKKNTEYPEGQTEFQFQVAELNFHSNSYEYLLVIGGGTKAKFKGKGTINGNLDENGNLYNFMIWAIDGDPDDTFRIRIWSEDYMGNETDIYDNGFDQPIGGGSIVIHTK